MRRSGGHPIGSPLTRGAVAGEGGVERRLTVSSDPDVRSQFLRSMRSVPGPVAIVASAAGAVRGGLTATAWNSLSADPPMLLACINRKASAHDLIQRAGAFSVNLVPKGGNELAAIFAGQRDLSGAERFLSGQWEEGPRGQPMLTDAVASFECELAGVHDYGSHSILVGRVGEMRNRCDGQALLYVDGRFASALREE